MYVTACFSLWYIPVTLSSTILLQPYRKFEETTSLNTTVEETLSVLNAFGTNSDQKLNPEEFGLFITKFAKTTGANLSGMIDFMIVASALKHNKDSEQKYIQSITTSDLYYWGS